MATNVTFIPPRKVQPETLRVAAYCRVSTDSSDQLHSYAAQIKAYTELISRHEGWELVDVYADEGLTGTRMDKREDFNRMMADCRKGRIDKVLVKSISRFARNARDFLASLRELSSLGVAVKFEKENIDTGTLTSELMVSVSGSLAQQESISISENQRLSYLRGMERGEFITCKAPFGYRLRDGKNLEIIPDEAAQVRWIFEAYLSGLSTTQIAEEITRRGFRTRDGKSCWRHTGILYVLTNEKYVGDSLCQKTYASSFPFVKRRNHGQKDQYYTESTHPAIVSHEVFNKVQELLKRKSTDTPKVCVRYPLTLKIQCGECGTAFQRRQGKSGLVSWVCRRHDDKASDCSVGRIREDDIYAAFVRMYNNLKHHDGIILGPAMKHLEDLNTALQRNNPAMLAVNRAIAQAAEQSHNISRLQTAGLLDADACAAKLAAVSAQLTKLRGDRRRLLKNGDIEEAIDSLRQTTDTLRNGPESLDTFDEELFEGLVERIIAESQTRIRFRLRGGIELAEQLREATR
ncbi:recombinase family protein [Flavonifractor plautii]|uniref:recombinase family protein n=1 Tax=Flavonifractor plautii TaxID=292800 RepID=UPI0012AB4CB8|nr:recombinase family protein [Flavonifractor plautii]